MEKRSPPATSSSASATTSGVETTCSSCTTAGCLGRERSTSTSSLIICTVPSSSLNSSVWKSLRAQRPHDAALEASARLSVASYTTAVRPSPSSPPTE
eukprot:scaffold6928_cov36-Tisochrysis_lutea.AAC.1